MTWDQDARASATCLRGVGNTDVVKAPITGCMLAARPAVVAWGTSGRPSNRVTSSSLITGPLQVSLLLMSTVTRLCVRGCRCCRR